MKEQLLNCGEHAATNRIDSACAANKLTQQRLNPIRKFWQLHNVLEKPIHQIAWREITRKEPFVKHRKTIQMINTMAFCTSKSKEKAENLKKKHKIKKQSNNKG